MKDLIEIIREVEHDSAYDNKDYIPLSLRDEEECKRIKNIIVPRLSLIEKEIDYLLHVSIRNCKNLNDAQEYFNVLQEVQEIIGGLFFRNEISLSSKMENFVRGGIASKDR